MDRFSSPFLRPCLVWIFFCKNERIVAPLPGHQSLIPLSSCSVFHYLSLLRPQDERNRREVVEDEERDGRYRRGLQDQVMLTGALPRPTRVQKHKFLRCVDLSPHTHTYARTLVEMRGVAFAESALREKNTKTKVKEK